MQVNPRSKQGDGFPLHSIPSSEAIAWGKLLEIVENTGEKLGLLGQNYGLSKNTLWKNP
ncbi:hypothetical protein [Laspinema palackyanum]|uniref:hypothetical protein n=1 Tax=Laspinema palackyanum TaxID=3231601 RepID=UPI00345DEE3B|nr:hypothetical protein [Laspinema sp. D2c]